MTKREQIINALKSALKNTAQIKTFFDWSYNLKEKDLPALILLDKNDEIRESEDSSCNIFHYLDIDLELVFKGKTLERSDVLNTINATLQSIKEARVNELWQRIELVNVDINLDQNEAVEANTIISIRIKYITQFWEI